MRVKCRNIWFSTLTGARRHFLKMSLSAVFATLLGSWTAEISWKSWNLADIYWKPPISSGSRCGNCRERQAITCWPQLYRGHLRSPYWIFKTHKKKLWRRVVGLPSFFGCFFFSPTWVSSDTTWGFPCELSASHVDLNFAHSEVIRAKSLTFPFG